MLELKQTSAPFVAGDRSVAGRCTVVCTGKGMTLPVPWRVRSANGVRTQKGTQTNTVLTNGSGFNMWVQSGRRRMAGYNMPSTDAFPPGRIGLYSTVANVRFDHWG